VQSPNVKHPDPDNIPSCPASGVTKFGAANGRYAMQPASAVHDQEFIKMNEAYFRASGWVQDSPFNVIA